MSSERLSKAQEAFRVANHALRPAMEEYAFARDRRAAAQRALAACDADDLDYMASKVDEAKAAYETARVELLAALDEEEKLK